MLPIEARLSAGGKEQKLEFAAAAARAKMWLARTLNYLPIFWTRLRWAEDESTKGFCWFLLQIVSIPASSWIINKVSIKQQVPNYKIENGKFGQFIVTNALHNGSEDGDREWKAIFMDSVPVESPANAYAVRKFLLSGALARQRSGGETPVDAKAVCAKDATTCDQRPLTDLRFRPCCRSPPNSTGRCLLHACVLAIEFDKPTNITTDMFDWWFDKLLCRPSKLIVSVSYVFIRLMYQFTTWFGHLNLHYHFQ